MKIYKYEIEIKDRFQLILPEKSRILSVQLRYDVPMLWALVDPDNYTIPYFFRHMEQEIKWTKIYIINIFVHWR